MFLCLSFVLGSLAEEDIGRHGASMQSATGSKGLEVAITNLQEYCNGMLLLSLKFYFSVFTRIKDNRTVETIRFVPDLTLIFSKRSF